MSRTYPMALMLLLLPAPGVAGEIVVYRCAGDDGSVSFQDEPCTGGQVQREQRYEAPVPRPAAPAADDVSLPDPAVLPGSAEEVEGGDAEPPVMAPEPAANLALVPPLFTCATFDGDVYVSEQGDGNRRCVPLEISRIGAGPRPAVAQACEWVVDDCRLLDAGAACDGWQTLQRRASRQEREAFSDTLADVREELDRLTSIRDAACSR